MNRIHSCLIGICVGDALGLPYEFKIRDTYALVTSMNGFGTHYKPPGTWSDDSSMNFCLVESIIDGLTILDLKKKYCQWLFDGYWTYDNKPPFDIGETTYRVLTKLKTGKIKNQESGENDVNSNGNGSLMRVLPLVFYIKNWPIEERIALVNDVSGITHAHIRSKIACNIYIEFALHILTGKSITDSYESMKTNILLYYRGKKNNLLSTQSLIQTFKLKQELKEFDYILKKDISNLSRAAIKSSGYVIDSLEATIWCLLSTSSFEEAVLSAVNLGGDTDTIGSLVGGLAGIHYGHKSIPSVWINSLPRLKNIEELCMRYSNFIESYNNKRNN